MRVGTDGSRMQSEKGDIRELLASNHEPAHCRLKPNYYVFRCSGFYVLTQLVRH